jgi:hypothetical protein
VNERKQILCRRCGHEVAETDGEGTVRQYIQLARALAATGKVERQIDAEALAFKKLFGTEL